MNVVGFEAFVLATIISRELFFFFVLQQPRQALHPAFIFSKRAKFLILTCSGLAAQICRFGIAGLMFKVKMYNNLTSDLKFKNQSGDQSQFHMAVVFSQLYLLRGMFSE